MSNHEDLSLLAKRAQEGDSEAWARVHDRTAPLVFRFCRRILSTRQQAEDATSEVFLKARMRLGHFDPSQPFSAWLYRTAAAHCWDQLSRHRTRAEIDADDQLLRQLVDHAPTPHEAVVVNETKRNVRRALAGLDDRSRIVVSLRYFAGLGYRDIGDILGLSENLVGVLILRARRALRARLQR